MPVIRKAAGRPARIIFLVNALLLFGIAGCTNEAPATLATLNPSASLPGNLPANPLQWRVITSVADGSSSTMSTLYGNDIAVDYARTHSDQGYPPGSELSLVTWTEMEDPRWFGAGIPDAVKSVEFLTVSADSKGHAFYTYKRYEGTSWSESGPADSDASETPVGRVAWIISRRAAVMP